MYLLPNVGGIFVERKDFSMFPEIPLSVKQMMAAPRMRYRHLYWHLFKDPAVATGNPAENGATALMQAVIAAVPGWRPTRLRGQFGHGIDFIHMHRVMISNVDNILAGEGDANWPKVEGWAEPPILEEDADWPMPQRDQPGFGPGRRMSLDVNAKAARQAEVIQYFSDFDSYAAYVEDHIHDGLHGMFSEPRPADANDVSVNGDWLGSPFSSHVNSYFWKLHGWVDDCVGAWETAKGETADLSSGWTPPPMDETPLPEEVFGAPMAEAAVADLDFALKRMFSGPPDAEILKDLVWP